MKKLVLVLILSVSIFSLNAHSTEKQVIASCSFTVYKPGIVSDTAVATIGNHDVFTFKDCIDQAIDELKQTYYTVTLNKVSISFNAGDNVSSAVIYRSTIQATGELQQSLLLKTCTDLNHAETV